MSASPTEPAQPVGAEQELVAAANVHGVDIDRERAAAMSGRAGEHIASGMASRFPGVDQAGIEQFLHDCVIACDLTQPAVAHHVGSGIADVGDQGARRQKRQRRQRRPHARQLRLALPDRLDQLVHAPDALVHAPRHLGDERRVVVHRIIQSGVSTARSMSVLTAVWLAISPATSPPIPSAITTA